MTHGHGFDPKRTLDRLPVGVVVVDTGLEVAYSNLAARGVVHPSPLLAGGPLPPLGDPTLEEIAARTLERGMTGGVELTLEEDKVVVVEGRRSGTHGEVTLVLHDVSRRARTARAEHDFVVNAA